jgi:hypothetical protein
VSSDSRATVHLLYPFQVRRVREGSYVDSEIAAAKNHDTKQRFLQSTSKGMICESSCVIHCEFMDKTEERKEIDELAGADVSLMAKVLQNERSKPQRHGLRPTCTDILSWCLLGSFLSSSFGLS